MAEEKNAKSSEEKKSSSNLKLIIIGATLVILVPIAGFFIASKFIVSSNEEEVNQEKVEDVGTIVPMPVLVVNVANTNGGRYLRAGVSFEVTDSGTASEIEKRNPQILDTLIMILTNKDIEDLVELTGKKQIRTEIKEKVNANLIAGKIKNVYFTEFVIQ
ncbi:flagellar basal body-associated FliL family protein [bacterium]|nr:flagellar basal body-associated FliL family protein [bacterium]MCP5463114.1 flagellar basal body-associated FliL family protein [bacterium]